MYSYTNEPIEEALLPVEVCEQLRNMASKYSSLLGPRFMEMTTFEGWFVLDRSTGKFFRKIRTVAEEKQE